MDVIREAIKQEAIKLLQDAIKHVTGSSAAKIQKTPSISMKSSKPKRRTRSISVTASAELREAVLKGASEEPLSCADLVTYTGGDKKVVKKLVGVLIKENLLVQHGNKRGTKYSMAKAAE